MYVRSGFAVAVPLFMAAFTPGANAEVFKLEPVVVTSGAVHPSQSVRQRVEDAFVSGRTSSTTSGASMQNINPVNKSDALRYNTIGTIGGPGSGSRFGGATKIRTFGDFGAAESIDGLPAFRASGAEGGGYTGTVIPSIAIDTVTLEKGGRAVGYGDGSDGGVVVTRIKSGRGYDNHKAISTDIDTAHEGLLQGEYADSAEAWDIYGAANFLEGRYNGEPPELDSQRQYGGLAKGGYNFSEDTRFEALAIGERNRPDVIRNGNVEEITSHTYIFTSTLDHRLSDMTSMRGGWEYIDTNARWPARNRNRSIDTHIGFADGYVSASLADGVLYDGSLGAEYKRTNYLRDNQYDLVFHDYALKSTNAVTFDDNLVLTLGLRPVWFENELNYNGAEQPDNLQTPFLLGYEAGAAYTVFGDTRIRGNIASGYNRFYSKYGNFGTDAFNPAGAQDAVVESRTLEAGVRQGWNGGYADVAVYNIVQDNVPRRNGGAIESVSVEQSGVEFESQHGFSNGLVVSAGFMYIFDVHATRADGSDAFGNVFFGTNGVPIPELQTLLRAEYAISRDWLIWGMGYYNTGYDRTDSSGAMTQTRDYHRLDLGLAWIPVDDLAFRFRVENILDEKDYGQTLEGQPVSDADKIGRVYWLGMDVTF